MRNVQILEQIQLTQLKSKSKTLEQGWLVIGSEPNPLLRFEFEAHLQQVYAALNIGASAVAKMLDPKNRVCSFRDLSDLLKKKKSEEVQGTKTLLISDCIEVLEKAKAKTFFDFLEKQSIRDQIVHFHCIRAKPVQVKSTNNIGLQIHKITINNVMVVAEDKTPKESHHISVSGGWSELLVREFVVFGIEKDKWAKDDLIIETGAEIGREAPLSMSEYSLNLFDESRNLLLGLLTNAVQIDAKP
jgi:hypothetical protein